MGYVRTLRVRGGSGLGDTLYVRVVAEYLAAQYGANANIVAMTNFMDVFQGANVRLEPHSKTLYDVLAHYTTGRPNALTNQWQDVCNTAGIPHSVPLSFKWSIGNPKLVNQLGRMANGKPIIMLNGGRPPMGRTDGYSDEMLPDKNTFEYLISSLWDSCFIVKVGKGIEHYSLSCHYDLSNNTTSADLLDIATVSGALLGQCSYMVPMAECLDKPFLGVWAERGLRSNTHFIRQCTPQKILCKPATDRFVIDNWSRAALDNAVEDLKQLIHRHEIHSV